MKLLLAGGSPLVAGAGQPGCIALMVAMALSAGGADPSFCAILARRSRYGSGSRHGIDDGMTPCFGYLARLSPDRLPPTATTEKARGAPSSKKRERRRQLSIQERIHHVLRDLQGTVDAPGPLGELGLMIEDLAVTPAGKRRLVRIWLDRDLVGLEPDDETSVIDPLSLDEVAEATRLISAALDASDALGEAPYVLEVGSAGVDRLLTQPRHFRRNVSRLVEIRRIADPADGALTGRLVAAGPTEATVLVAATKKEPETRLNIPYSDIARAQVQVEFARVTPEEES
jgi:ribosome maturation factor RimP